MDYDEDPPGKAFHDAIEALDIALTRRMLEAGEGVNVFYDGCEPLHRAVRTNNVALVQLLLDHGAIVIEEDYNGRTPLHFAVDNYEEDSYDILELLLKHGANCNDEDEYGVTPFLYALRRKNLRGVELLWRHGSDITMVDEKGKTALHYAVENAHGDVVQFVLDQGLDIERVDSAGHSPLDNAIFRGTPEICEVLLWNGAMVNRRNRKKGLALEIMQDGVYPKLGDTTTRLWS